MGSQRVGHDWATELNSFRSLFRNPEKRACVLSSVQPSVAPWTVAGKIPLSVGSPRREYWSRWSCPSPGDLPDPGLEPASLYFCNGTVDPFPPAPHGEPEGSMNQPKYRNEVFLYVWLIALAPSTGDPLRTQAHAPHLCSTVEQGHDMLHLMLLAIPC